MISKAFVSLAAGSALASIILSSAMATPVTLSDVEGKKICWRLSPAEAERLLEQALCNIEIMLSCNVVHGDLSAYNMLYSGGHLRVIDLPQAVDARTNRRAKSLLIRDVANVCGYFAAQGADAKPGTFAEELWDLHLRAAL
jgi:RIO kinase 1